MILKSFDEIYNIVEESSHQTAFNREECEALYDILLRKIPHGAKIVEIGIEYGRSTSVIAEIALIRNFNFFAVDNWCQTDGKEAQKHVFAQIAKHDWKLTVMEMDSIAASRSKQFMKQDLDLVHIDGDHTYAGITTDLEAWLPKIKSGGFALFDDYGHDSLPDVYRAVGEYLEEHPEWQFIERYGNKLGVFQKK